jgi:hypothetical protein
MKNAQAHSSETETFERRLRAYVVGAGAVAAGLLACSPPAIAEIVVTHTHATLDRYDIPFPISLRGETAFTLSNHERSVYSSSLLVIPASGAAVVGRSNQVAALKFGAVIGGRREFEVGKELLAFDYKGRFGSPFTSGPFANTTDRFLGLKFELNGQVHYGWAGFRSVIAYGCCVTALLEAYAYETEPNTPIYAGQSSDSPSDSRQLGGGGIAPNTANLQPATLGVLALGSLGLDAWRKRESGIQESS